MNERETIKKIFDECKNIAVVGLSSNPFRPSNGVAAFMQKNDYKIFPVNPNEILVLGEKAFANIADLPEQIDLVDIFRRSDEAGNAVDEAIKAGAKAVWLQEGVIDEAAAERAEKAGLLVVMNKCWLKEYMKYGS
jgi:uncharacterized protein